MSRWYRQLTNVFDRPWATDAKAVSIYLYLHCCAYVQDGELRGIRIRRGSCMTSRTAIMEATGLSESDVKTRLRFLASKGEIILNSSNLGTIITCCDYDSYNGSDSLFDENFSSQSPSQLPNEVPSQLPSQSPTTPYNRNNGITEISNLRTHNIPSKIERDNAKKLIYEIKDQYNATFKGLLRQWQRLTAKMVSKVEMCIQRFGRQSIDMVFDQIRHEQLNMNKNGFVPDFDFIFSVNQYETYLERYKLRISKKPQQQPDSATVKSVGTIEDTVATPSVPERQNPDDYRREMREYAALHPDSYAASVVAGWDN